MEFEIRPEEVKQKLERGETFTLLDVREPWEYQMAHIAGSTLIPMDELPSRAFRELDPEQHIVVVCHHGVRSANVANWLLQQGFGRVQSMRGGIAWWSRFVDLSVPRY